MFPGFESEGFYTLSDILTEPYTKESAVLVLKYKSFEKKIENCQLNRHGALNGLVHPEVSSTDLKFKTTLYSVTFLCSVYLHVGTNFISGKRGYREDLVNKITYREEQNVKFSVSRFI